MVKEQFYGLRWFIYIDDDDSSDNVSYPISCLRHGYFVPSYLLRIEKYPDYGSKVHWEYWAKHKLLVPESFNEW